MTTQYKENLIINARYQMKMTGGKCKVTGKGPARYVILEDRIGRKCTVWFPEERRVKDLEIEDMKDAILEMSGKEANRREGCP